MAVPGEGLVSVSAVRQRLRLLERHDAANCVECARAGPEPPRSATARRAAPLSRPRHHHVPAPAPRPSSPPPQRARRYRLFAAALSNEDGLEEATGTPMLLDEEESASNVTSLMHGRQDAHPRQRPCAALVRAGSRHHPCLCAPRRSKWVTQVFRDDDDWKEMMASEDMADVREEMAAANGTLIGWFEPVCELLGRSTRVRLSPGDLLDLDELIATTSGFPLLLVSLTGRQGNTELLPVYYLARTLGRLNVLALASFEGRDLGSKSADEVVAEQEATFVRRSQQEVLNSVRRRRGGDQPTDERALVVPLGRCSGRRSERRGARVADQPRSRPQRPPLFGAGRCTQPRLDRSTSG
ncbi:hypothetical protein OAO87_00165 [bacterium]|nr:hypothetical protein [bacterium]